MSALLKNGSAALHDRVRPLAAHVAPAGPAPDPERERLEQALAMLEASLAARDETVARLEEEAKRAFGEGEEQGRAAGRLEAEDLSAETLARIEEAAGEAVARFAEALGGMERLAVLLARTCLERMLLAPDDRAGLVCDLIRGQAAAFAAGAAVRVTVSAADFPSPEALDRAAAAIASPGCEILASDGLAPGDCTIALQLGTLEIGIGQQWGALSAELEAMIAPGGTA